MLTSAQENRLRKFFYQAAAFFLLVFLLQRSAGPVGGRGARSAEPRLEGFAYNRCHYDVLHPDLGGERKDICQL